MRVNCMVAIRTGFPGRFLFYRGGKGNLINIHEDVLPDWPVNANS